MGMDKEAKPNRPGTANQQGGGDSNNYDHCAREGGIIATGTNAGIKGDIKGWGTFKGRTKEIKNDILNNTGPHNAAIFNKSLKNTTDYIQL